jgi:ribonuclease BN (tRNA processing enzyme)
MSEKSSMPAVPADSFGLRFLGVGGSHSEGLGPASAALECGGEALLLIDCGHGTPLRFHQRYQQWPRAVFVTHVHLDHIGGLEQLYSRVMLEGCAPVRLFVPSEIVHLLHQRLGSLGCSLAEGQSNFWDAFQIVPVSGGFWCAGRWFDVFEGRHHAPRFAFGLRLAGRFLYTGDTRPIPELLRHYGNTGERLFHDCALEGNPSHTGWDDIVREYDPALRRRMVLYHYESEAACERLESLGAIVARPGRLYGFCSRSGEPTSGAGLRAA